MKARRGYIDFEIPEPNIKVNEKCEPIAIEVRPHGRAQKMIEDFMVAANEAVTIYAAKKVYPFVYRVHDKPKPERMEVFAIEAKRLNFKIDGDLEKIRSVDIAR
jgi:ribonuclease R